MNPDSALAAIGATLDKRQQDIDDLVLRIQSFAIETPSWGYGNSGTRFKVFAWPGAAHDLHEKLADAAMVQRVTGACPSVALHIPWDKTDDWQAASQEAHDLGLRIGAINPNLFQDEAYKLGSLAHPHTGVRRQAVEHVRECIAIAKAVNSSLISLWLADGTNYPGQDDLRGRRHRLLESLQAIYADLPPGMRLLIEYKFFEPAFYSTDLPDWGTSFLMAQKLGPQAEVLVDTGHHAQGTNVAQIVAQLLDEDRLGGFHFNDRKAEACGGFISLSESESYAVEYWPLEQYKLKLAPPEREFSRQIVLVTGAAGGIGSAISRRVARDGAQVVLTDIDLEGAKRVAEEITDQGGQAVALRMDVTEESSVRQAMAAAALAFGGLDCLVNNAGLASSARVTETSLAEWQKTWSVLVTGYFLVAREGFLLLEKQGCGGSLVFIASKNALVAGKNASAYSTAKAAEAHLARCLAEEGGQLSIRVNTVNPDAVLAGSRIWDSSWRAARAATYGVAPDQLEEVYRQRTTLGVNIVPEDVAEAVAFFASPTRASKSTGNILNVDGGVAAAYPR